MSDASVTPEEALDRLFTVIRKEAVANPKFAKRLFDAVGTPVKFQGNDAALTADPVVAAKRNDHATFREMFSTFSEADLKKMVTNWGLSRPRFHWRRGPLRYRGRQTVSSGRRQRGTCRREGYSPYALTL